MVFHPESGPQKKIALETEQESAPHRSVSYKGSSASDVRPSATASTDQNTSTSDVTRASSKDHSDGDVPMEEDTPDESSAGRPNRRDQTAEGGSQQKENHVKSDMSNRAPLNSTFRKNSWGRRRHKNTQSQSPRKKHWTETARKR